MVSLLPLVFENIRKYPEKFRKYDKEMVKIIDVLQKSINIAIKLNKKQQQFTWNWSKSGDYHA